MIKYQPDKLLEKIAPAKKIKKLLSSRVTLKKAALNFVNDIDFLDKKGIERVALKTIKGYKERIEEDTLEAEEVKAAPAQLIQRVQNEIVFQIKEEIKTKYDGHTYVWLPSDAEEPRPEHQLNYGKEFEIGVGEMPGDAFGCRCGMQIVTKDSSLNLS